MRHLHPAAHLRPRRRRGRRQGDPRPGRKQCRRSPTAARPTPSSSRQGLKYSDGDAGQGLRLHLRGRTHLQGQLAAARPSTPTSSAPKSSPKRRQGGIPGIKTDDKTGKIVINLIKPRGTFTNELALMFVAPVPARARRTRTSRPSRPPATGPYDDHQVPTGQRLVVRAQPALGEDQREGDAGTAQRPRRQDRRAPSSATPRPRSTTSSRASSTGCRPRRRPTATPEVKSKYEGTQFRVEHDDQHLLLLDEHDQAALRRPQGAPGGQLRGRPGGAGTDLRRPAGRRPSRSCRRGCRATRSSTSTRTTWPRRRN